MKLSANFDLREFVPPEIFNQFGTNSIWFINAKIVALAEFYKDFFFHYYTQKFGPGKIKSVLIIVNDWHTGGSKRYRGFRMPDCSEGGKLSQHKFGNAFDCDIIIVLNDGTRAEADYKEVQQIILLNEALFMSKGLTTIESIEFAPTWLHSDCRYIPIQTNILVVKPLS